MINEVIYLGQLSADPASPTDGMIWYNVTLQKLRKREGGVTSNLDTTGGGGGLTIGVASMLKLGATI